ncbi:Dehydration-responsive element-binding protein 2F [Acorus gramineus]|uniref:Dehydration-responsive element-binding protein 2F n=1 Tax=Acorus gramineus TaxID=55184 RepID=A0AAV9A664_ACOGR|nr:Dehydration-responsive element-binding protein 2F [Acorus gramineus]
MDTFRKPPSRPWKKGPTRGKGGPQNSTCEYRGAARRLYGPDAYLNLPHLQSTITSSSSKPPHKYFKWFPSKGGGLVSSMFPSCGLLNLGAQHNVHVIHQRLQQLKGSLEKPQIDLNEFLQQLGVLKEGEEEKVAPPEAARVEAGAEEGLKDGGGVDGGFEELGFNWETLIEMRGLEEEVMVEAMMEDVHEGLLSVHGSIWDH